MILHENTCVWSDFKKKEWKNQRRNKEHQILFSDNL